MNDMMAIVSTVIPVLCLVGLAVFTLIGLIKRTFRAISLLLVIALSALLAGIFCKPIAGAAYDFAATELLPSMLGSSVSDLMANEVIAEVLSALLRTMIAPIVFLVFFIAAYFVLSILDLIVCAIFRLKKKAPKLPKALDRLAGAGVGFLCGVLFIWAIVTPLFGYMGFAGDIMSSETLGSGDSEATVVLETVTEAPVAKQIYALGGERAFDSLSTVKWQGDKVTLRRDTA